MNLRPHEEMELTPWGLQPAEATEDARRTSPYRQAMSMTRDEFNIDATICPVEVIDL
jgi:hypothetical protein